MKQAMIETVEQDGLIRHTMVTNGKKSTVVFRRLPSFWSLAALQEYSRASGCPVVIMDGVPYVEVSHVEVPLGGSIERFK